MAGPGVSLASRFREFVSVSGTLPQSGLVSKYFGHATFPGPQSSSQDVVTSTHRVSSRASQCRPGPQRFLQITPASFGQVGSFFFLFVFLSNPRSVDASSWHPVVLIPMAAARGPKGPTTDGTEFTVAFWMSGCPCVLPSPKGPDLYRHAETRAYDSSRCYPIGRTGVFIAKGCLWNVWRLVLVPQDLPTWPVTSWKRGLLATRVGEASHPGPSDIFGAALWEANPSNDQGLPGFYLLCSGSCQQRLSCPVGCRHSAWPLYCKYHT